MTTTNQTSLPLNDQNGGFHDSISTPDDTLRRADELLQVLEREFGSTCTDQQALLKSIFESMAEMSAALHDRDQRLARVTEKSEAMARAQADAIVYSAEIIDELERTREHLSQARSAAELAAQDTQRLADTIFERTNDGVLVLHNRQCIACNDNALKLLNCNRGEIFGRWPEVFEAASHEDGTSAAETLRNLVDKVIECGVMSAEVLLPNSLESTFWAEITASSFNMKDAGHVLFVVRDITSRKQLEVELRQNRDFLDNIINAVPDQLSVIASDQTLVVANDAFCASHGVSRDDVVGQRGLSLLNAAQFRIDKDIETQLLTTGECTTTEYPIVNGDGSNSTISVKRSMFEDETSGRQYVVSTSRDITEDRIREDRLRLFASVFKGASEGVAIISLRGHIREANPAFLAMVGEPGCPTCNDAHDCSPEGSETNELPIAAVRTRSAVGNLLTDALQIDVDDFTSILRTVAAGLPWSGKGSIKGQSRGNRSYWVSLSPSAEMGHRATQIIALVSDITELENTQRKLRWQALYDNLTGLPNRRFFREHLQQLVGEARNAGTRIAVCFLDLDDFKHVNDSAGHSQGDHLLQEVGTRIQKVVGKDAFVARFGGDEFSIIFQDEKFRSESIDVTLASLQSAFREPFELQDTHAIVGLSVGVTHFPDHATDVDTLMCNADIAMYSAKVSGKNRVRTFSPEMQAVVNTRHQVQSRLRQALNDGELTLWFQPKVCAVTKRPAGCEALVRWQTADGEFIPPGHFIPIAEQTGLIGPLGTVVFELAASQAVEWFSDGIEPSIAVNVSAHQLRHPRFIEQLTLMLERTGARAEWFELEITEYAMMDDVDLAVAVIDDLTSRGFRVAIDDFGTGYSSLSYLKNFRINTLKIDSSFVSDVTYSPESNAVVRSIISLGLGLNLTIVAEGVETADQAALLAESGCTLLQGYYFGKPMPAKQYSQWLAAHQPPHS